MSKFKLDHYFINNVAVTHFKLFKLFFINLRFSIIDYIRLGKSLINVQESIFQGTWCSRKDTTTTNGSVYFLWKWHTYVQQTKFLHVFSIKYLKHTILCPLPIIQLSHKVTKRKVLQWWLVKASWCLYVQAGLLELSKWEHIIHS